MTTFPTAFTMEESFDYERALRVLRIKFLKGSDSMQSEPDLVGIVLALADRVAALEEQLTQFVPGQLVTADAPEQTADGFTAVGVGPAVPAPTTQELLDKINDLLDGMARCEDDPQGGWWQTSDGSKFGRAKLRELKELIASHLATPPATAREAAHDGGAIMRWLESRKDLHPTGWPDGTVDPDDLVALIDKALDHWGRSDTREAGAVEALRELVEAMHDAFFGNDAGLPPRVIQAINSADLFLTVRPRSDAGEGGNG